MKEKKLHAKLPRTPDAKLLVLPETIRDYLDVREQIPTGRDAAERIAAQKRKIMNYLGADEKDWTSYKWQLANRFSSARDLCNVLEFSDRLVEQMNTVGERFRFAVSPYYLSLIDPDSEKDPIWLQSIPAIEEMDERGELDPMDEVGSAPVPCVTRRYPDRLIVKVTNMCGMYCRFCQRRRRIGEHDTHTPKAQLETAVEYIASQPEIRDVLVTGGDAFMLSDGQIEWLLRKLRAIPHVEIIRFGTRTPVTLPQRITPRLCRILQKYHPVFVNTHFNSPMEVTEESAAACAMLANVGVPLGNQMVLLAGVNDHPFIVRRLNQALLQLRVKPYYIFHPKAVRGTSHFWVSVDVGMEIMERLRGYTSGMAVPTYIVNGPGGLGKTPISPNYLLYMAKNRAVFRNWNGEIFGIDNLPMDD